MSKENVLRTEYGICPKCNGNGWVFPTNVSSSMTEVCNYCNGTKSVVTAIETKQAIESCVNPPTIGQALNVEDKGIQYVGEIYKDKWLRVSTEIIPKEVTINDVKYFSQSEVDTIREDLWNRCREWADGQWSNQFFPDGKNSQFKYPTLQDYINTVQGKEFIAPASWAQSPMCKKEPEPPSNKDKDWRIISVLDDNGDELCFPSDDIISEVLKRNGERIQSVQRISDGIVFSIGDKVGNTKPNPDVKYNTIEKFTINNGEIYINDHYVGRPDRLIDTWIKLTPTNNPTEETDKAVTNNDDVACLSLNDLRELDHAGNGEVIMLTSKKILELVKSKLKQLEVIQYTFDNPKGKIKLP